MPERATTASPRGLAAIDELNQRLASPKTRMKTTIAVEKAATDTLTRIGATHWITVTVAEHVDEQFR